jgi:hypothetical protein
VKPESETRGAADSRRSVQIALALVTLAAIAAVSAVGYLVSQEAAIAADGSLPLSARTQAARRVMHFQQFSGSAEVTYAILEGRRLFAAKEWDEAQKLLYETYLRHIGNKPLRAELSVVSKAIILRDAGKAHKQHGHEGPGGTLRPEDVEQ